LFKKGLILLLLLSADWMEQAVGMIHGDPLNLHLRFWGSLAYCVNEFISIIENCDKCGVPIPKSFVRTLLQAKQFRFARASNQDIAKLRTDNTPMPIDKEESGSDKNDVQ
jgi:phage-related holin